MEDRTKYENEGPIRDAFISGLLQAGFDSHGYRHGDWAQTIEGAATRTENFEVNPYGENGRPNFRDLSRGIVLYWYKWPLREASSNKPLDESDVRHMMADLAAETRRLGAKPVEEVEVDLSPLDERLELMDVLCANPSAKKIPERLLDAWERMLEDTSKLRRPQTSSELAWAIRLDDISKPDRLVLSAKGVPASPAKRTVMTYVCADDEKIEVDRSIRERGFEVVHTVMFSGDAEKFNDSIWSTLTMERLGRDCPNLEGLRAGGEEFVTEPTRRGVKNVSMLDIRHDELDGSERAIRGIAKVDFVIDAANGKATLVIDETDGSRGTATFDVEGLRRLCLLAKLREKDLFDINVEKGCAAARVCLGRAELISEMEDLWEELDTDEKKGSSR